MNNIKSIIIIFYYLIVLISVVFFRRKLKLKTGNKVGGSLDIKKIPKSIIWLPILATLSMILIILFPFLQLFITTLYEHLFPIYLLNNHITFIIGSISILLGLIILIISQMQLGNSYRILLSNEKAKLITTGLYSFTRNPLYIGAYISFIGIFLMFPSIIFLILLLIVIVNNHFRIFEEEKALLALFGDEYNNYKKKVKRYFVFFIFCLQWQN